MNSFINANEATRLFSYLPDVLQAYIAQRAGKYGIPPHEVLMKMPSNLHDNPVEIFKFLKSKDVSHLTATNAGGSPSEFTNWTFEDAIPNSARQDDPMKLGEYLDAQLDNQLDSLGIEFATSDPGSASYNEAFSEAFGIKETPSVNLDEFIEKLTAPGVSHNVIETGEKIVINAGDATDGLLSGLVDSLAETGVPVAYIAVRGFGAVLPFLRSINSKKFRTNSQYRQATLARALRLFRENGWKDLAKSVVVGFLIAMFPPISYFVAAVGLTGVAAMGTRWLAHKCLKFNGPLADALDAVADALTTVHAFLKRALDALEKIVEVVVEVASNVTKRVVKAGSHFASAVYQVSKNVVTSLAKSAGLALDRTAKDVKRLTSNVSTWIFSWFSSPGFAV